MSNSYKLFNTKIQDKDSRQIYGQLEQNLASMLENLESELHRNEEEFQ